MQDNGYRIIKLKNGDTLIAKLIEVKKNTIIIERPMQYKIVMLVDQNTMNNTEMLVFKSWIDYGTDNNIELSADGILAITIPDSKLTLCYDMEKEKEDNPSVEKPPLESLSQIAQNFLPGIPKNPNIPPENINVTFNVPPEMAEEIVEMMAEAKSWEDIDEELEDEDLFPEVKPPKKKNKKKPNNSAPKPPHKKNKKDPKEFGNDWNDWSPDPKDYI